MEIRHDGQYTLEDVLAVANGEPVTLNEATAKILAERREQVEDFITLTGEPAYGFNRGFGHNVDTPVLDDRLLADLQENLIRSHAAGVGDYAPREIVRATMFIRAVSLSRGYSGVRPLIVGTLVQMLNKGVVPCVPRFGSVGASGDLAPLAHICLVMIERRPGDDQDADEYAWYQDSKDPLPAEQAMSNAGIRRIRLKEKEGLAFINGSTFSTALGALECLQMENLLKTAVVATAMSTQVMLGADTPFREDLHQLRPHPGSVTVAHWIWSLMEGSPMRDAHESYDIDGEIQDPYNIRCAAQILGACHELIREARRTLEIEITSTTDNPVILALTRKDVEGRTDTHGNPLEDSWVGKYASIVSGGHFHGMPIAVRLFGLLEAAGIMARLSNMRCVRYVDKNRNKGLNDDLKWRDEWQVDGVKHESVSSGMMIPEYVSASLTNHIWGACMPTHLFSLSTDAGQEDHTSMAAGLALRLWETLPRLAEVLAIELAFSVQAAEIRERSESIPSKVDPAALVRRTKPEKDEIRKRVQQQKDEFSHKVKTAVFVGKEETPMAKDTAIDCEFVVRHRWQQEQRRMSKPCEALRERIRREDLFPPITRDRYMSRQLRKLADWVMQGEVVKIVENALPSRLQ